MRHAVGPLTRLLELNKHNCRTCQLMTEFKMVEQTVPDYDTQTRSALQTASSDLIARHGSTSLAWRWFDFEKTNFVQKRAIDKLLRKSATNLFHHVRFNHCTEYAEYEKIRQSANFRRIYFAKLCKIYCNRFMVKQNLRAIPLVDSTFHRFFLTFYLTYLTKLEVWIW